MLRKIAALTIIILALQNNAAAPTSIEFNPVEIKVLALNRAGHPLQGITVHAINHEYLFRQKKITGPDGTVIIKGIPGTWSFYGTLGWNKAISQRGAGYAPIISKCAITRSGQIVTLQPDTTINITIHNRLPGFTGKQPTSVQLIEPQYGPMIGLDIIGIESGGQLAVDVNNKTMAQVGLVTWPLGTSPGLFYLGKPLSLDGPINITVNPEQLGKLRIEAYDKMGLPTEYHLQVQCFQRSRQWAPSIADLPTGPHEYYLSPGDYVLIRALDMMANQRRYRVEFNQLAWAVKIGDSRVMCISSPSQYRMFITPKPAPGFGDYTQVLLDVRDNYDNQVIDAWTWGPDGPMRPHARITTPTGRIAEVNMGLGFTGKIPGTFNETENPRCEISWDFGPHGNGVLSGSEYTPDFMAMYAYTTDHLIPQSPAVHRGRHDAWVDYYDRIYREIAQLLGVPTDYPLGIIQNIMHAGFADEIHGFKTEISMELRDPPNRRGGNEFYAHEEGHGRIQTPPANFSAIKSYGEAYATVMGYEATARVTDTPRYVDWLYGSHDFFLRHLHGEPIRNMYDEIEIMQFITYYLRRRYGFDIHRRMILEWDNALKPARTLLAQQGYSDLEQFVAVYSYLAKGDNLAWLFRIGGLDVQDSRAASAVALITQATTSAGGIKLVVGETEAVHNQVSVPLIIQCNSTTGFHDIQVTLAYDSTKALAVKVYKRDLTYPGSWQLTSDITKPGEVILSLSGIDTATGVGSIAQVNFKLMPKVTSNIPISVISAKTTAGPVATTNGRIIRKQ